MVDGLRRTMTAMQDQHRQELAAQASSARLHTIEIEAEIRRHRERTVALLSEKDRDIEALRRHHHAMTPPPYGTSPEAAGGAGAAGACSEQDAAMAELLGRTALTATPMADTTLLHFAEEQARRDVEINTLRRQKHDMESALRGGKQTIALKEDEFAMEIEKLKEDVRKLERNKSRESANLEYLKNVVYQYMVSYNSLGRQQMLRAISTILQFSPKERERVQAVISRGWWGSER